MGAFDSGRFSSSTDGTPAVAVGKSRVEPESVARLAPRIHPTRDDATTRPGDERWPRPGHVLECGSLYGVSERSRRRHAAGDLVPRCESCRSPALEPDAQDRKWADERLDDLARAVAALH